MGEVAYRCEKCRREYPLSGARGSVFVCEPCGQPLKRVLKPPSSELGIPQFKGEAVKLSRLFRGPDAEPNSKEGEGGPAGQPQQEPADPKPKAAPRPRTPESESVPVGSPVVRRRGQVASRTESKPPSDLGRVLPRREPQPRTGRQPRLGSLLVLVVLTLLVVLLVHGVSTRSRQQALESKLLSRIGELEKRREQDEERLGRVQQEAKQLVEESRLNSAGEGRRLKRNFHRMIPDVVAAFSTAVVHIMDNRMVWIRGRKYPRRRTGSGFIIPDGYAVTNYHVVSGAKSVRCRLFNGEEVEATVHGSDPASDIALLRLDLEGVPDVDKITPARFGRSSDLRPGEMVIALGSPKSLDRSISLGVVSNTRRYQRGMPLEYPWVVTGLFNTWIQTDSAINPGSSGGPLIDMEGRVVGVVTRKILNADNIGFASPVDYVKYVVAQLLRHKAVPRSTIGAFILPHTPSNPGSSGGVRVADVMPRSPAQEAGLKAGDVLVSYNGKPLAVRFSSELPSARMQLATGPLGRPVELVLERGGRRLSLRVTPRSRKVSDDRIMYITGLGFYASEVNPELVRKQRLNCKSGIWVCGVEGGKLFARHGIRKGEVLVGLANHTALTMEIFWKEYRKMLMKKQTLLPFMVRQASGKTRLVKLRIVYPK